MYGWILKTPSLVIWCFFNKDMMLEVIKKYFSLKVSVAFLFILFSFLSTAEAQSCASSSRNSWEWPGHNNWFLPLGAVGNILNQTTGVTSPIQDPGTAWDDKIAGYQGVTCASNDRGELLFFSNGIRAWRADGTKITKKIWSGRECGFQATGTSASHGIMTIRHPLNPERYYIITIDDVVNQGYNRGSFDQHGNNCSPPADPALADIVSHGICYAVIDSSANLVHASQAIETNILSGQLGQLRTTEGFGATLHANGVDIWVTFQPLWATHIVSYLLTCEGFVTPPVVSGQGIVPYVDIDEGLGDIDFTQDGRKMALGVEIAQGAHVTPDKLDAKKGHGTLNVYDFDNKTGEISNRKAVHPSEGQSGQIYSVIFAPDGKWLHYSGTIGAGPAGGMVDITSGSGSEQDIRDSYETSDALTAGGFYAAAITAGGQLKDSDEVYKDAGLTPRFSVNDIYIPPLEEPDIHEIDKLCNDDDPVDIHTYWVCGKELNGDSISAEDSLNYKHNYFILDPNDDSQIHANSSLIIGVKTGIFNPAAADIGFNKVVFIYCQVNDTIEIEVEKCSKCTATLAGAPYPELCIGNEIRLDTFIIAASASRKW